MASRTLLYDLFFNNWSKELCALWGVSISRLARIIPSIGLRGRFIYGGFSSLSLPVMASIGDKEASTIYGVSSVWSGDETNSCAVLDLGTLATLTVIAKELPNQKKGVGRGVLCSWRDRDEARKFIYQQELRSSVTGDALLLIKERAGRELSASELSSVWAHCCLESDKVLYFTPRTSSNAASSSGYDINSPLVFDLTKGKYLEPNESPLWKTTISEEQFLKLVLEHILFSVCDLIQDAKRVEIMSKDTKVVVSGGLTGLDGFCNALADLTESYFFVGQDTRSGSALGAAYLASCCYLSNQDGGIEVNSGSVLTPLKNSLLPRLGEGYKLIVPNNLENSSLIYHRYQGWKRVRFREK